MNRFLNILNNKKFYMKVAYIILRSKSNTISTYSLIFTSKLIINFPIEYIAFIFKLFSLVIISIISNKLSLPHICICCELVFPPGLV